MLVYDFSSKILKNERIMRILFLFVSIFLVCACTTERDISERDLLLTSTVWKEVSDVSDTKDGSTGYVSYKPDGTYEVVYKQAWKKQDLIVKGVWKWVSESEIATQTNEMILEGVSSKLDYKEDNYHILRVTELSKGKLEGIGRHMLDAENSGFAKTESFIASAE